MQSIHSLQGGLTTSQSIVLSTLLTVLACLDRHPDEPSVWHGQFGNQVSQNFQESVGISLYVKLLPYYPKTHFPVRYLTTWSPAISQRPP